MKEIKSNPLSIRFAGDSGDGIQALGELLTRSVALDGYFFSTKPDFPSEIRAPAGSTFGVSGFQLSFSNNPVLTPGDACDLLFAMNPASFSKNINEVKENGTIFVNCDTFTDKNLEKAGISENPLLESAPKNINIISIPMTSLTLTALESLELGMREADRCKNLFAYGVLLWILNKDNQFAISWIKNKFSKNDRLTQANILAVNAGFNFASDESNKISKISKITNTFKFEPGKYRSLTGNQAISLGLLAAAHKANLKLILGSYPITPASDIMHELAKHPDVCTVFQAEDEIAAIGAALGASYGGAIGVTTTSGPGLSLKSEFINLAVMTELPLVIVDVQRAGPSTGMPTKMEQADLLQALFGRHGESPIVVFAPSNVDDCFYLMLEAVRTAIKFMTPVIVLSDSFLANTTTLWKVPDIDKLPPIDVTFANVNSPYQSYARDEKTLSRTWAPPGIAGLEHRLGGLEKLDITGVLSSDAVNHEKMTNLRHQKIQKISEFLPDAKTLNKSEKSSHLVVCWGSVGPIVQEAIKNLSSIYNIDISAVVLQFINPFPKNLPDIFKNYKTIFVAENNCGQLAMLLRSKFLIDCISISKVQGQPFQVVEIENAILSEVKKSNE